MKIIITVATYWPATDGVQAVTQYHAEGLAQIGNEVIVITSDTVSEIKEESHNNVKIIRMDAYNYLYWHRGDKKKYQNKIIDITKNADALLAVCLQSFSADWLLDIMNKISCKKILYMHGMPDFKLHRSDAVSVYNISKTIFRNIRWKLFYEIKFSKINKFDGVIHLFENDNSHKYFKNKNYKHNFILENAADRAFFDTYQDSCNKKKQYIYVGNYCNRKNQITCLRAFYEANANDGEMIFIGSKENLYYAKLKEQKQKFDKVYGYREVKILCGIPRNQVYSYVSNAYACIMSSNYEYFPVTLIESMACGIPFISTNVGNVRYLPGGVVVNTQEELKYWITLFHNNSMFVYYLGKAGHEYANEHYRVEKQVNKLFEILQGDVFQCY